MWRRSIPALLLALYSAFLFKIMVLREIPLVRVGRLMLHFGGADADGSFNLIPFKTVIAFLMGSKGLIIVGINIIGNIVFTIPFGVLLPFVFRNISWKTSLLISVATGFLIEGMQVILHTGIFDIDDVILNGFGVMIGYWLYLLLTAMLTSPRYRNFTIALLVALTGAALYVIALNPGIRLSAAPVPEVLRGSQLAQFPPNGVACYESFVNTLTSGYADPSFNLPQFDLKNVTHFRCSSSKGFSQYEVNGIDATGAQFYVHHAGGGMAASGADTILDHCYKSNGVVVKSIRMQGTSGATQEGTCIFDERFPPNAESVYIFNR